MAGKYCIFCERINKKDKQIFLENDYFCAWWDEHPVTNGHSILISKKHVESFFELNEKELTNMFDLIKKVKQITDEKFHPDGYNIGINEGEAAGRTIHHLHVHIIPRYKDDVKNPRGGVRNVIPGKGDY